MARDVKKHLADADLVGIVGTTKVVYGSWARAGPPYTFGQVCEPDGQDAPFRVLVCAMPAPLVHGMQAVDGLFMAANREVLERVRFDEVTFDGFHCYDIDFSFSSHLAGFRVAVAADMPVLHASAGNFDPAWETLRGTIHAKHAASIPPSGGDRSSRRSWVLKAKRKRWKSSARRGRNGGRVESAVGQAPTSIPFAANESMTAEPRKQLANGAWSCGRGYNVAPPDTSITAPLMYDASLEASHA